MKTNKMQTSEIREKVPGFDRRDRTVRGHVRQACDIGCFPVVYAGDGYLLMANHMAGESLVVGDLVELENGLWWRA